MKEHREEIVRRRTQFDLNKAKDRAHILEGLVMALEHIDEIIATINHELEQKFNITHTTFQLECEKCDNCAQGLVCQIQRLERRKSLKNI